MIRVHNYEILHFDSNPLIHSNSGVTKITNKGMARALQALEKYRETDITIRTIKDIFIKENIQIKHAIRFLQTIAILGNAQANPYFQSVRIFCEWPISHQITHHIEKASRGKIEIMPTGFIEHIPKATDAPTLFIAALSQLTPCRLRAQYYEFLKMHPSCGISVGFISGNHYHITEPYIATIKNPCAFCTIDRIIHYENLRKSQHPWSRLVAFCDSTGIPLPTREIDELQKALILGAIIKLGTRFMNNQKIRYTQDRVLRATTINLDNGYITEDPSVHWPLCKCLEKSI